MFSFLHTLIVSLEKTSMFYQESLVFWTLKVTVAIDLRFVNHQGPQFQMKIIFSLLLKKENHLHIE